VNLTKRQTSLIIIGAALLMFGGIQWMRHRHNASYPMPPREFFAQVHKIEKGMAEEEVRAMLKGVTREARYEDTISFGMEPHRRRTWTIPLTINMYINVRLDAEGRVEHAWTSDG
jgi:hypothetical protein